MHVEVTSGRRSQGGKAVLLGALILALGMAAGTNGVAAETRLKFIAWNYQVETVQEFIAQFEAENPDIKVDAEFIPSAQYAAKIQLMRNANTPFDALYVFDHILGQWASWLEPLDDYPGRRRAEANPAAVGRAVDDL